MSIKNNCVYIVLRFFGYNRNYYVYNLSFEFQFLAIKTTMSKCHWMSIYSFI